jgi:hypothetical protein
MTLALFCLPKGDFSCEKNADLIKVWDDVVLTYLAVVVRSAVVG